jgi:GT2 family glycosyltransferase
MDLSIIIVNWNSAAYTVEAVESVTATTGHLDYEVLVVDNASTDDSREILEHHLPRTTIIRSPANLGFARGNNLGARQARGRVLLFLNPDTCVLDGSIEALLGAIASSPAIGVVGARLLNRNGTLQTSCVQSLPTVVNQVFDAQWLRRHTPTLRMWGMAALFAPHVGPIDVEAVSGACLMVQRHAFEQVGAFSEDYFLYAEDLDLCHKMRRGGYRVCHVPTAHVIHYGGGSSRDTQADGAAAVLMRESVYRFLRKTRGPAYARRYRRAIKIAAVARIALLGGGLLLPLPRDGTRSSLRKWQRIFRWTRGFESWAERIGTAPTGSAAG